MTDALLELERRWTQLRGLALAHARCRAGECRRCARDALYAALARARHHGTPDTATPTP